MAALALALAVAPLFGQALPITSCRAVNGRAWIPATGDFKLGYLRGLLDGLDRGGKLSEYYSDSAVSFGELLSAVDAIYADSVNVLIPIADVVWAVRIRLEGATTSQLEKGLAVFRKHATDCVENKPAVSK